MKSKLLELCPVGTKIFVSSHGNGLYKEYLNFYIIYENEIVSISHLLSLLFNLEKHANGLIVEKELFADAAQDIIIKLSNKLYSQPNAFIYNKIQNFKQ